MDLTERRMSIPILMGMIMNIIMTIRIPLTITMTIFTQLMKTIKDNGY